jgi:hypothetical protein
MSLQETPSRGGRRATKFSPANVQKFVAQGFKREELAEVLEVTVGSLQVTCSRLGISLRIPKIFDCSGDGRRTPVLSRPNLPDDGQMRPEWQCARFQIVLARNGVMQDATDVPFLKADIGRLRGAWPQQPATQRRPWKRVPGTVGGGAAGDLGGQLWNEGTIQPPIHGSPQI